jgi:hypothetical protein
MTLGWSQHLHPAQALGTLRLRVAFESGFADCVRKLRAERGVWREVKSRCFDIPDIYSLSFMLALLVGGQRKRVGEVG